MARNAANRRKYRRIPAPIHCRPAGEDFFAQHLEPIDISFGGLRTYSDEEYVVGTFLRLDIFFSGVAPVTINAEVMWVKALGRGAPARFDLGLAFVDLKADALNVLRRVFGQTERSDPPPAMQPSRGEGSPGAPSLRSERPPASRMAIRAPAPDLTLDFPVGEPVSEIRPITPSAARVGRVSDSREILLRVPTVIADAERICAMKLGGRAGFLLALIDGITSVESLLDLSGMPADETVTLLEDLKRRGIIALH